MKQIHLAVVWKCSEQRQRQISERQKKEYIQQLNGKDQEIERLRKKNDELDKTSWQNKQKENEMSHKVAQQTKQMHRLENEIFELKRVQPQSSTNKSNQNLETKVTAFASN